ncbi:MAG: site-specific integrase [Pseudomonadota bacterium]
MPRKAAILTDAAVKRTKPRASQFYVRDGKCDGLELAVYPSGAKTWFWSWARGKRAKLGSVDAWPLAKAREQADAMRECYREHGTPYPPTRGDDGRECRTLADFITGPFRDHAETNYSRGTTTADWLMRRTDDGKGWQGAFAGIADKKLADLSPIDFERWKATRRKAGIKDSTIHRDLAQMQSALKLAVTHGYLEASPAAGVKLPRLDRVARVRYLDNDEERRLLAAVNGRTDYLRPLVLLALNTGLRRGELFALQWHDARLTDSPRVTVEGGKAKSGQTRHVPLNKAAKAALVGWKATSAETGPDALVFPSPRRGPAGEVRPLDNIKRAWAALLRDAKVSGFRFHDCRHHFASRLVMAGVPLNSVRELLGHADLTMTLRYAHLAPDNLAAAVEVLG